MTAEHGLALLISLLAAGVDPLVCPTVTSTQCVVCPFQKLRKQQAGTMVTQPPKRNFFYPSTTCIFNLKRCPITLESS